MSLIVLDQAVKRFGAQTVFSDVALRIEEGEKLGLIGRNGGGKTTLVSVIAGTEELESGSRLASRNLRVGLVDQRPVFPGGRTVIEAAVSGLEDVRAMETEMRALEEKLAEDLNEKELERTLHKLGELQERFELHGGYELEHRIEAVLHGLGFTESDFEKPANALSGGEKSRLAMAQILVQDLDLLLLDEPTNHVDLIGVEWLESFISEMRAAVLIVSHDRRFLDRTVSGILELDRGRLRRFKGNYTDYEKQSSFRKETDLREYEKQQAYIQKELAFIRKHMGSQRTAEAKGRQKKLERLERIERPQTEVQAPRIKLGGQGKKGDLVLEFRDLTLQIGDRTLFENLQLSVLYGDRIGIVGPNGAGKTTLIKALLGLHPPAKGKIQLGSKAKPGYYDQNLTGMNDARSILKETAASRPELSELDIRSHLARFLFVEDEIDKLMGVLSGGERARVALAKLTLEPYTFLLMDEPTNHLDIAARKALEGALADYEGTILVVSHDRYFLDQIVDRVLYVDGERSREYIGDYSTFEKKRRAEREAETEPA